MLGFPDVDEDGAEEEADATSANRAGDVEASAGRQRVYNLLIRVPWQVGQPPAAKSPTASCKY
eukprot:9483991-Pyramimonas_sp.AAC.2